MKREFSSLTSQEALHVAIFIEERNAELYGQFAEMFAELKDPESLEIAQVFWDMSNEERSHGTRLQELYFERFGTQACVVTEDDIREMIEMLWMPRLEEFKPQMIFISAGFDAHREDDLGQLRMNESDYAWITMRVKEIARKHARGRIVSSLEGGYNLSALGRSVEAHLRALADL